MGYLDNSKKDERKERKKKKAREGGRKGGDIIIFLELYLEIFSLCQYYIYMTTVKYWRKK